MSRVVRLLVPVMALGCAEEPLPGHVFAMEVGGIEDNCNPQLVEFKDSFEYRLVEDASGAYTIYIGEVPFGTGSLVGCDFTYGSLTFSDEREDTMFVRWSIVGTAQIAFGGDAGCDVGEGWKGEETIQIAESTDPAVPTGCTYVTEANGVYLGENVGTSKGGGEP